MDNQPAPKSPPPQRPVPRRRPNNSTFWLLLVAFAVILFLVFSNEKRKPNEIAYGQFYRELEGNKIASVEVQGSRIRGEYSEAPDGGEKTFEVTLPPFPLIDRDLDEKLRRSSGSDYSAAEPSDNTGMVLCRLLAGHRGPVRRPVVHVPPHPRPVPRRRADGRLQQEPGPALRDRATSRSPSTTWPAWRASRTSCRRSSSSSRTRRSSSGSAAACPRACC